jgi:hypothetical protein
LDVYLDVGSKRVFASAVDWPGWARNGRDEQAALSALLDYGRRYRAAMGDAAHDLKLPATTDHLRVVERADGNATTDFGAPGAIPDLDRRATDNDELDRLLRLLKAAWAAFDTAAKSANGHELAPSGPRGGGRTVARMRDHVLEADAAYLRGLGGRHDPKANWAALQEAFVAAAISRAHGELPEVGPRGGKRWPARYAIRRSAWHALDHAWEIEDRLDSRLGPQLAVVSSSA